MGARFIDRETNTSEVEIRPPREEVRIDIDHTHSRGVQVPSSHSELTSHDTNIVESPLARLHIPDIMLQLDGPVSVHARRRRPVPEVRRKTTMPRGGYPDESDSVTLMIIDHVTDEDILEEEDIIRIEVEDHQIEKINQDRGYPRRGRPQMIEDPPMMVDPLMMEDPPDDGGPPGNGRPPRQPGRQGPPGPPGPPGPVCLIMVQQPQVTLDTTTLENTFGTVGQSILQLARAQDQTNRYLQEHLQHGQMNMQVHTGALQQLATSTYQWNFDHIFASYTHL